MSAPGSATASAVKPGSVICAGILVSDLFIPPLAGLPPAGQLVSIDSPLHQAGGCAANTGIDLARLGVQVGVCGTVGDDALGTAVITELARAGVDVTAIGCSARLATSQTVILSLQGEDRRFLHSVGANAELTADTIGAAARGADILVIGGVLVLPGVHSNALAAVLMAAATAGSRILLDVAIPQGSTEAAEQVRPLLEHVWAFLPNEDEGFLITGVTDPVEQARTLRAWGCPRVVVTCGARGAIYADAERVVRLHPLPTEVVDGSGAGDAFTAGMVVGLLRNWPVIDTLRYAAALGASVCRGLGCHTTLATDDEARAAMAAIGADVFGADGHSADVLSRDACEESP